MKAYEVLSHQAGVLSLVRLRQLFYKMRRAGTLTEKMVKDELPNGFWLHFGFKDVNDYLVTELHYSEDEVRHLLDNEKEKEDQNGQSDRKDTERTSAGEDAGPGNAGAEKQLW